MKPGETCLNQFFNDHHRTLEQIKSHGWRTYVSSSGSWWWEKYENGPDGTPQRTDRQFLPMWILELLDLATKQGEENVRQSFKDILGIKGKSK